jgi:hypothetical protein
MPDPVLIDGTALDQMPDERIGLVCRLALIPVHLLPWIMLIVSNPTEFRDCEKRVGEIVEYTSSNRSTFAGVRILR